MTNDRIRDPHELLDEQHPSKRPHSRTERVDVTYLLRLPDRDVNTHTYQQAAICRLLTVRTDAEVLEAERTPVGIGPTGSDRHFTDAERELAQYDVDTQRRQPAAHSRHVGVMVESSVWVNVPEQTETDIIEALAGLSGNHYCPRVVRNAEFRGTGTAAPPVFDGDEVLSQPDVNGPEHGPVQNPDGSVEWGGQHDQ